MATADMDTQLDAILVQATAAAGASGGTGARTVAITVNDGTTALESARVRLTKGAESYLLATNASGVATFSVDDGTWAVVITLAGYTFTATTLVVDGNETQTYSMTAAAFTPSTQPDSVTVRWLVIGGSTRLPKQGVAVTLRMRTPPEGNGYIFGDDNGTDTSDANGMVEFANVPLGSVVVVTAGSGTAVHVAIPENATEPYDAGNLLGDA
jgi:hypothetical protein